MELPQGWHIETEKTGNLKKRKNELAHRINSRGSAENWDEVLEITREGTGKAVKVVLTVVDTKMRYKVFNTSVTSSEQVGEPFSSFENAKERAYRVAHQEADDIETKTAEGYVWNVEEAGGMNVEDFEYNVELSESAVEYEPTFKGTFDNRNLEPGEPSNEDAKEDLEMIQAEGLRVRVTYFVTRSRAGYQKVIDYEVIS